MSRIIKLINRPAVDGYINSYTAPYINIEDLEENICLKILKHHILLSNNEYIIEDTTDEKLKKSVLFTWLIGPASIKSIFCNIPGYNIKSNYLKHLTEEFMEKLIEIYESKSYITPMNKDLLYIKENYKDIIKLEIIKAIIE